MDIKDAPQTLRSKVQTDLVARISPIIHIWDPEGFIRGGAPKDEYEHEVEQIAGSIYRIHSEDDATTVICDVGNYSFGALFGVKPGTKPKPNEGYRPDGYDGERIKVAGKAVFEAVTEHRAWLLEATAKRRESAKKHVDALMKKYGIALTTHPNAAEPADQERRLEEAKAAKAAEAKKAKKAKKK